MAVWLFLGIALIALPGTFLESRKLYSSPPFLLLLGLFGVNLVLCTVDRFKRLSAPVLVMHGGVLLTLAGCILTALGYVATVNIYEGSAVDQVFRWDLNRDAPLGAELKIRKINRLFYPIPVQVGVLKGEKKEALFTLKTGDSFTLGPYRVQADALEFPSEVLKLSVYQEGNLIGNCDSAGAGNLPTGFPYAFKLVAFKNPRLKRLYVDLTLSGPDGTVEGTSEVNAPFSWGGLYFYNTQIDQDQDGRSYAGIQIVRDPGRPYVFSGFALMGVGAVMLFFKRFFKKGLWK